MDNVVLFGFMGAENPPWARCWHGRPAARFWIPTVIWEQKYGRSIPQIFASDGEEAFRRMERAGVPGTGRTEGLILCCGGGTVLDEENADILAQSGVMVFLDAAFPLCYDRIRESDRPLVRQNSREKMQQIFDRRRPVYLSRAQVIADASVSPMQVADAVLTALRRKGTAG